MKSQATNHVAHSHGGTCPNCGYCPCCGRGRGYGPYYPYNPWYVSPQPTIVYGKTDNTSYGHTHTISASSTTGSLN